MRNGLLLAVLLGVISLCSTAQALEHREALHLLLRTGFGPEQVLLRELDSLSREQAVDTLLSLQGELLPAPGCLAESLAAQSLRKHWSDKQRLNHQQSLTSCAGQLRQNYVAHLLKTPAVLHERMTLFWHNHFTTSIAKVRQTTLIYQQHRLLHENALGSFRVLLQGILNDPAMRLYLDNISNSRRNPNENLARELFELFTLGEGHYTEKDIKEAARALTGYSVDQDSFTALFHPTQHDFETKQILGKRANFDLDELIETLLKHPQTSENITRKVWLEFISEPNEEQITKIAKAFAKDWSIHGLVRRVLLSDAFWADQGRMIKSPVELVIGTLRLLPSAPFHRNSIPPLLRQLGQDLFTPPNVKGWPRGIDWVDASKLMLRINFIDRLLRGVIREAKIDELSSLCPTNGATHLTALPLTAATARSRSCFERLSATLTDPIWQLK